MAVSQMRRVQIFVHNSHRKFLIKDLQEMEIIHINNLNEQEEPTAELLSDTEIRDNIRSMQNDLTDLETTIDYLAEFEPKKGFLEKTLGGGIVLSPQEFNGIGEKIGDGEWRKICDDCNSLQEQITRLNSRENKLNNDKQNLIHWSSLDAPIEDLKDTEKTIIRIGTVPESTHTMLIDEIKAPDLNVSFELVGGTKNERHIVFIFLKEDEQKVTPILSKYGFSPVSLPIASGKVSDQIKQIEQEISDIKTQREDIAKESSKLASHRTRLMVIYDYKNELMKREEIRQSFVNTDQAFMVDGWVRKKDVKSLQDRLQNKYEEIDITISEPTEEEEPPIYLENRGPAAPFKMVTGLYGLPTYRGLDPTSMLAPFFALSLGICLTDAGYGIVIALLAYFISRKITGGNKNLFRIFVIAGSVAVLVGIFTGGWFGIDPNKLPPFMLKFRLFDPMGTTGQLIFMGLVVVIGFIQVWFGNLIKMRLYIQNRDWVGAFLEQLPWLLALAMLPVTVYLHQTKIIPSLTSVAIGIILLCLLSILLFAGRESKNPAGRVAMGLFELYSRLSGTLGDVLSYMRLFALGLSAGIFAGVVNTMAGIMWGSIPGKIGAIAVLIGGHSFNILMSCLGGFIHTTRLQFVEFFTKFYESGGSEFRPFRSEYAYIAVADKEKSAKK